MEIINLPRLRVNQLQTLCENSLKICEPIVEIASATEKVKAASDAFATGMLKDKAFSGKKELDLLRDELLSGLIKSVHAEQQFPHEDAAAKAVVNSLVQAVNKYGTKIKRLPFDEETAAIDNLLADLATIDFLPLNGSGLSRWIEPLKTANNEFKTAVQEYVSDLAEVSQTEAAYILAPALIDALEGMYTLLYANLKINPTDQLNTAYAELEQLVNSYR
ncbi:MAG: hypothetical protein JXR65_10480 [Bacteroidales bacterium]|nr:hypothetical protein [Bacteroidales bacterium]